MDNRVNLPRSRCLKERWNVGCAAASGALQNEQGSNSEAHQQHVAPGASEAQFHLTKSGFCLDPRNLWIKRSSIKKSVFPNISLMALLMREMTTADFKSECLFWIQQCAEVGCTYWDVSLLTVWHSRFHRDEIRCCHLVGKLAASPMCALEWLFKYIPCL